jgi:hypothetical protein
LGTDDPRAAKGDLVLAGEGGGFGGWDDWEVPGGGGYKEGEAWTRGKKDGGSDLGAPPRERKNRALSFPQPLVFFLIVYQGPQRWLYLGGAIFCKKEGKNMKIYFLNRENKTYMDRHIGNLHNRHASVTV